MTIRNREYLRPHFQDGERPSGDDFRDLIESCLNISNDLLKVGPESLALSRGLTLGDSEATDAGTLRFRGDSVQFHNGTGWVDLASGGTGAFQPVGSAGDVVFGGGNVGIGSFAAAPIYRLEIDLGANTSESERVRFGNAVCSNGSGAFQGYAYFSHKDRATNSSYALRQGSNGNVHLNAASGQPISIRQSGNQVRLGVSAAGNVVVGSESDLSGAGAAIFQVSGRAFKTDGSANWATPSDARLKDDVRDLDAGLEQLVQVRPVRFRYNGKAGTPAGREGVGIIGQEMERIFPEMVQRVPASVDGDSDTADLLLYDSSALTYVLVNAVKELAVKVKELEAALSGPAEGSGEHGSND